MTALEAQAVAQQLGNTQLNDERLQAEIQRLNRKSIVSLEQTKTLHAWLEGKRLARQSCRVVGERSRRRSASGQGREKLSPVILTD